MIGVVLVHYHTPGLAEEALGRLRREQESLGEPFDVVLVDNGSTPTEAGLIDRLPARVMRPGENLGYAGGLELGVREVRGDVLLLMNPDVLVDGGCVAALLEALDRGASAAGPLFTWDREGRMLLPPAEERSRRNELFGRLARRGPRALRGGEDGPIVRRYRARWRRHARRHWLAAAPLPTESLSGALLAVRRAAWQEVGPFDAGYRLYFEETDWLRRLVRAGGRAVQVPAARAVHLYDRSASIEPQSAGWFAASRRRFERRWYGAPFAALLAGLDRLPEASVPAGEQPAVRDGGEQPAAADPPFAGSSLGALRGPLWVEVSPSPLGVPAAAERVGSADAVRAWRLPREIRERLPAAGRFRLQVVAADGEEGPCSWLTV